MAMSNNRSLIVVMAILLAACSCNGSYNRNVRKAIIQSGSNSKELKSVLAHYKDNPLKYRAACYLIGNMPGHFTYTGEQAEAFASQMNSILNEIPYDEPYRDSRLIQRRTDSLIRIFQNSGFIRTEDISNVRAAFLIANIDSAFNLWENSHWADHLDFEEFCETLLPYTFYNGYQFEDWRTWVNSWLDDSILEILQSFRFSSDMDHSSFWACKSVNGWLRDYYGREEVPKGAVKALSQTALLRIPYGECAHFADIALIVMRSLGIPVMEDFTPQWPFRSLGHTWNVLISTDGRRISFSGCDIDPDVLHKPDQRMAKVYRRTYAHNSELVRLNRVEKTVPDLFSNVFVRDVTGEYMKTIDIKDRTRNIRHRYAYLAVFDNAEWQPVCYGRRTFGGYTFKEIGKDIVYLPVFFTESGLEAIDDPFIIDIKGKKYILKAQESDRKSVSLKRKYFLSQRMHMYGSRIIGGRFEASDKEDFRSFELAHTVKGWRNTWDSITVNLPSKFRYWRYVSPKEGLGNIAEVEFRGRNGARIHGKVIGSEGSYNKHDTTTNKYAVFDGNPLTYFDMPRKIEYPWAGMDFGAPVDVAAVYFLPRNDDNNIRPGDEYELTYWADGDWKSLGRKFARDTVVCYDNVPANALLLLHDLTGGKEERPFTLVPDSYSAGELAQRWW